jgi:hypothetical protein
VGQEVVFAANPEGPDERRLADFLKAGEWGLWASDTVLGAGERVEGNVLVLEAAVRIAGEITGDVFVVDGDLFLRPGSRIRGDAVVLGGGYYGSSMAVLEGNLTYRPNDLYRVTPREGGRAIHPVRPEPKPIELHGLYGFKAPTYQRVNSVTLAWGITGRVVKWPWRPSLELVGRFHTAQAEFEGTAKQYWHPSREFQLGLEAERVTRTNEEWAKKAVSNSLSYFFVGDDFRDYYSAERVALMARRSKEGSWSPWLSAGWERARSLEARNLFFLFGPDNIRENPAVDEGDTWSLALGLDLTKRSDRTDLVLGLLVEAADSTVGGDFSFLFGEARARWEVPAFLNHRLDLFAITRGDLVGSLPRQRWSAFGGRPTLPTFPVLFQRGPRLVYGHATYIIPVEPISLGFLGTAEVLARIATGAAWKEDESASFKANLIAGGRLSVLELGLALDLDASDLDPTFYAVFRFSGDL